MSRVGVLGAGSWGTALAVHAAGAGERVVLWGRDAEQVAALAAERVNAKYLPGVELPPQLEVTTDLAALAGCDPILAVVPSHAFRDVWRQLLAALPGDACPVLVSAIKGIETEGLARMSGVWAEERSAAGRDGRFAVISGPTFAAELAAGVPSAAVVASESAELAEELSGRFSTATLRLYSSTDVVGVELGGAAKNVIAIAAGVLSGLGLGHNTLAALITRGLHEMTRLGTACGGQRSTFSGLAGLGDLVLTCTGGLSRNRRTGLELAQGKTLDEINEAATMVSEGIRNSLSLTRLARRRGVEMPITEQMMEVMYENKPPRQAVEELMTRELKPEAEL